MQFLYQFSGKVQEGNRRGHGLGFPTANVPLTSSLPEGIYFSQVVIKETIYPALTMIGTVRTFNESAYQSETYILNFDKQIYNQIIQINILQKIRDNEKFNNTKDLIEAMEEDKRKAKLFFKLHS